MYKFHACIYLEWFAYYLFWNWSIFRVIYNLWKYKVKVRIGRTI